MTEVCRIFRGDLDLYAAGELLDSSRSRRVRRHLDRCSSCREHLARYDVLTRELLSGAGRYREEELDCRFEGFQPEAGFRRRADRIVERIEEESAFETSRAATPLETLRFEPSPEGSGLTHLHWRGDRQPGGRQQGYWRRVAVPVAASLLFGLLVHVLFLTETTDELPSFVHRRAVVSAIEPPAELPLDEISRLRWVFDDEDAGGDEHSALRVLDARSGDSSARTSPTVFHLVSSALDDGIVVGFRVEERSRMSGFVRRVESRFFLVSEEDLLPPFGPGRRASRRAASEISWLPVVPLVVSSSPRWQSERALRAASRTGGYFRVVSVPTQPTARRVPSAEIFRVGGGSSGVLHGGLHRFPVDDLLLRSVGRRTSRYVTQPRPGHPARLSGGDRQY